MAAVGTAGAGVSHRRHIETEMPGLYVAEDNGRWVFCDVMIPAIASQPPLHSLKGRKGCKVAARVETRKRSGAGEQYATGAKFRDWTDSEVYCKGELAGQVHRLSPSPNCRR
ncbi:unnamed protein product [Pleuronectes platessa]|uniref:Uncharacterized protein n=1 Tax=Pleuronectes platessa TaxID=8262 RepID=A0A9N7Z3W0_PLEPL|nr:unnamed protein product [Pleuronectes platessa]